MKPHATFVSLLTACAVFCTASALQAQKTTQEMRAEDTAHRNKILPHLPPNQHFLDVPYVPGAGDAQQLDIYTPPASAGDGPFPLVVVIHGGGWNAGDKGGAGTGVAGNLLKSGFVVASINYRFLSEAPFPAQIEDCYTALNWLREHAKDYKIDPNKVGLTGHSAGGHLVALLAASAGTDAFDKKAASVKPVQAAEVISGVSDLRKDSPAWPAGKKPFTLGLKEYSDALNTQASPITYLHKNGTAYLIIHGDADTAVPVEQSTYLADALKKAGTEDITLNIVPGKGHDVMRYVDASVSRDFFSRVLKGVKAEEKK